MKSIKLEKSVEKIQAQTEKGIKDIQLEVRTTDLLKTAINNPKQGGYSVQDMKVRIKLLEKVEKAEADQSEELHLEDSEFKALGDIVKETKWNVLSKNIIDFSEVFEK